jgi:glucose 1-dehydrogenase
MEDTPMKLAGKTALVTGAGRGIGKGCALDLARAGADVVVNDRPGSPDLATTADEIRALGRHSWPIEADVFSREGCETLVSQSLAAAGRIDILVSNPALNVRADFLELDPSVFERIVQGALTSGFHMGQLVARHMVARRERGEHDKRCENGGKIIFISSIHDSMPYARSVAYNAAKAGLTHLATSIAVELCRHRINVNVIEPGWIDTPGEHESFGGEAIAKAGLALPWGRLGLPEDIGKAAVFLASDDADYVTGTSLVVDGGFLLHADRP